MTFLVQETAEEPHGGVPTSPVHWLTEEEIAQKPKFVIESSTVLVLKSVGEKLKNNEPVYPCEVLECVKGANEKRRETDRIGERPQLVRAKSLEDQMLLQSSYGPKGELASFGWCSWWRVSVQGLQGARGRGRQVAIVFVCVC